MQGLPRLPSAPRERSRHVSSRVRNNRDTFHADTAIIRLPRRGGEATEKTMVLTRGFHKFALTAHVTASVGWLGTVAAFLVLAIAGMTRADTQVVRGVYLAMDLITWFGIVPLAFASLVTGLVMSLGTAWGLFRHYWVVAKLLINVAATLLLLLHTRPIGVLARAATSGPLSEANLGRLQVQLVVDAGLALLALLVATGLAVYKPRGLTPYGRLRQHEPAAPASSAEVRRLGIGEPEPVQTEVPSPGESGDEVAMQSGRTSGAPRWVKALAVIIVAVIVLIIGLHLAGLGLGGHH